ncbi:MAG TPA: hypothetical protein VEK57_15065 [Thermoanaerobaculia bacterium]|nr:hypothetical protein [Thermoanaerobaculia bacterium]
MHNEPDPATMTYEEAAAHVIRTVQGLHKFVEGFGRAREGRRRKISTAASYTDEQLHIVAACCDESEKIRVGSDLTGEEVRSAITFSKAFRAAYHETTLFAEGIDDTIAEKRAVVGRKAAVVYKLAESLSRADEKHHHPVPHLFALRELMTRGRRPKGTARIVAKAMETIKEIEQAAKPIITITASQTPMEPVKERFVGEPTKE